MNARLAAAVGLIIVLRVLPLFFAAMILSEAMRREREAPGPLASNLIGSVSGGVLEYDSLMWGIKSLCVMVAVVYAGAWLVSCRKRG